MDDEVMDAVIRAAEVTANQASGNDKNDWNNFAEALRVARARHGRDQQPHPEPHA